MSAFVTIRSVIQNTVHIQIKPPEFFNFLCMKWFIIKQHWRRIWREQFEVNLEETFVHQHKM